MELKSRHEDLIKIIGHIKNDKVGILSYKNLDSYYKLMYKHLPSKNIVDFMYKLTTLPVYEYVDNIEDSSPLLNSDGNLNDIWDKWHINMTSQGKLDDVRFNIFRNKCFELAETNMSSADELYRITRTFIIKNPIIEDAESLRYLFMTTKTKIPISYKKISSEYIRDSYDILKTSKVFKICSTCGYVKNIDGKIITHRLCNPTYTEKLLPQGTLVLKPEIFNAITNPGRFEVEVNTALVNVGFNSVLFPEIERLGDVYVNTIGGDGLYLDMKAYNVPEHLYGELVSETGYLKEKYRNRWIIVPDLYYHEQLEFIGQLLRSNGSKLYNIEDLIKKLNRIIKEGK